METTRRIASIFLLLVMKLINIAKNWNCDVSSCGGTLRKLTALCCGIPCAGVRVRAVQSSQNPEKAPGFTRAAVGETPRNSRIRLSPNIFCIRVVKDSRRLYSVWLEGRWPVLSPCVPLQIWKKTWLHQNFVILIRLTNLIGTRGSSDSNSTRPRVTSRLNRTWNNAKLLRELLVSFERFKCLSPSRTNLYSLLITIT